MMGSSVNDIQKKISDLLLVMLVRVEGRNSQLIQNFKMYDIHECSGKMTIEFLSKESLENVELKKLSEIVTC